MLGGNLGDVEKTFDQAILLLNQTMGKVISQSSDYTTEAWGPIPQGDYLNRAIKINTLMPPLLFLNKLNAIEHQLGRMRIERYGPRKIDIDIIYWGFMKINHPKLTVPHPEMHKRKFVLEPLLEIIPNFKHPILNKTTQQLISELNDSLKVTKK
jgi:2-amino-4-hydroxy-6-hydroxymethyldihydropteridine diphosphokinase